MNETPTTSSDNPTTRQATLTLKIEESRQHYANSHDLIDSDNEVRVASDVYLCLAERIAACVNACAGISNPAAIPQLVEAARLVAASDDFAMVKIDVSLAALDKPVPEAKQAPTLSRENREKSDL